MLRTFQVQMLALTLLRLDAVPLGRSMSAKRWCPAPPWNLAKKHASILDVRRLFWKHVEVFATRGPLGRLAKTSANKIPGPRQTARAA